MLQRWRKRISIALTPDSIAINTGKTTRVVEVLHTKSEKRVSWNNVLITLEIHASNLSGRKVKFIISNNYVRYAILPWQSGVYSQQDCLSLAENQLRKLYGNVVDNWKISVAMQGYGKPMIISAIDHLLLSQLELLAKQFDWTIEAIEPAIMTVMNHHKSKIKHKDHLMMVEPERILFAEITNGDYLNQFSIICPLAGQEVIESGRLIQRSMQLKHEHTVHLFGNHTLLPNANSELNAVTLNSLVNKTQASMMSLMLAGLK